MTAFLWPHARLCSHEDALMVTFLHRVEISRRLLALDGVLVQAGELEKAFEWCGGTNGVTQLRVEGTLSNKDVEVLKGMTALKHLK